MNLEQLNEKNFKKFESLGYKDINTNIENSFDDKPLSLVTIATKNNIVYLFRFNFEDRILTKEVLYYKNDIIIDK